MKALGMRYEVFYEPSIKPYKDGDVYSFSILAAMVKLTLVTFASQNLNGRGTLKYYGP